MAAFNLQKNRCFGVVTPEPLIQIHSLNCHSYTHLHFCISVFERVQCFELYGACWLLNNTCFGDKSASVQIYIYHFLRFAEKIIMIIKYVVADWLSIDHEVDDLAWPIDHFYPTILTVVLLVTWGFMGARRCGVTKLYTGRTGPLPSWILNLYGTKWPIWRLFASVSTFLYSFLATCAILSWLHSAFESMLNFSIVS